MFTWVRDEDLADQVYDAIGGDDVLLQHHLNAVDCQAVAIAADLYVAALGGLKHWSRHDGFGTLGAVQQVEVDQRFVKQIDLEFQYEGIYTTYRGATLHSDFASE